MTAMAQPDDSRILPVILAGGMGTRLAPISTPARPKPFVPLADGESLLSKTLARVNDARFLPPLIIGRVQDRFALLNHARAVGVTPAAILLEATGCNTAAAVAVGALWAAEQYGSEQMLAILPADHAISPEEPWRVTVAHAATAAAQNAALCLVTATPSRPEPGFGYALLAGSSARHPWRRIARFVEKPADPQPLIAQGARWNMGQFIGRAGHFLRDVKAHAPATFVAAEGVLKRSEQHWEFTELPAYPPTLEPLAFDCAVLERAPGVAVPFTGQWQDLGDLAAWQAFTGLDAEHYARQPARTDRPWGYFEQRHTQDNEVHKLLILYPGCRLSRQRHQRRAEHWQVISGTAFVELDEQVKRLESGDKITIPARAWHRLANHHTDILIIEEIQMGICDENDIERADDDYGRK